MSVIFEARIKIHNKIVHSYYFSNKFQRNNFMIDMGQIGIETIAINVREVNSDIYSTIYSFGKYGISHDLLDRLIPDWDKK